ncbi:MAG TPA: DUF4190 domain-containing protein [Pseudonocardia sp.]|jgi:hypothetical protein|uniref:DUF4190 domain-containing protein n=1 Tax=Pseudonocardia sp. TaxID=60912 RepID=UPI002F41BEB7
MTQENITNGHAVPSQRHNLEAITRQTRPDQEFPAGAPFAGPAGYRPDVPTRTTMAGGVPGATPGFGAPATAATGPVFPGYNAQGLGGQGYGGQGYGAAGFGGPTPAFGAAPGFGPFGHDVRGFGSGDPAYRQPGLAERTNTLAILALVFGFCCAPAGIVLGIIARKQTKQYQEPGEGMALAGIIVGAVIMALFLVVYITLIAVAASTPVPTDF